MQKGEGGENRGIAPQKDMILLFLYAYMLCTPPKREKPKPFEKNSKKTILCKAFFCNVCYNEITLGAVSVPGNKTYKIQSSKESIP